ncbi:MAG: histidine phosphatase family protein [Acidimicrobiales bacterium]
MTSSSSEQPAGGTYPQHFYEPPAQAGQVLLIRHGQSQAFNPASPFPLVDGHGDPPLSPLGEHQAKLVGARLADEPISAIYVSTLTRTHQTAAPLAARLGIEPTVEPDLREVFLGIGEGGKFREMAANDHPAAVALRANAEWGEVPGAETNQQLTDRTVGAVRRIATAHPDQMAAAFCHGGVIAAVLGYVMGVGAMSFNGARHTSISHLVVELPADDPQHWTLRLFNDGGHSGTLTGDHHPA